MTVDAIFIVQQIMEKANDHQVPRHLNFVDFKAAFGPQDYIYDSSYVLECSICRMVQSGNRSEIGLFVITYPVQSVPKVCHGRPEELSYVVLSLVL